MQWPACSLDMNPIEQLLYKVKRTLHQRMDDSCVLDDLRKIAIGEYAHWKNTKWCISPRNLKLHLFCDLLCACMIILQIISSAFAGTVP